LCCRDLPLGERNNTSVWRRGGSRRKCKAKYDADNRPGSRVG